MTSEEEKRIVERVKNGEAEAFELLVIAAQNDVYALALKMLGDREDALDASQDAFLRAYSGIAKFKGDARFTVWMYRITYNVCLDKIRRSKRSRTVSIERDEDEPELQIPDGAPSPEERILTRETAELVQRGLETLPPKLRGVLVMREVTELSYAEIARATGLREGTVKSRISRARAALSDYLIRHGTFTEQSSHNKQKGGDADA